MANTIVNVSKFAARSQMYFRSSCTALDIASYQFQADLQFGYDIDLPYGAGVRLTDYTFGSDITKKNQTFTSDKLTINQKKAFRFETDYVQNKQAHDPTWWNKTAEDHGAELARNGAQLIAQTGVDAADKTLTLGGLSVGQIGEVATNVKSILKRQRVPGGVPFMLVEPEYVGMIELFNVANGFQRADSALANGFVGEAQGFRIYECEDLPCTQTLTLAATPSDGDILVVGPMQWTYRTTADSEGEIKISGYQANTRAAVNGTGTGDGTDYFETSVENRDLLSNAQISMGAFSVNVATVTGYGRLGMGDSTFTSGSNVAGVETCNQLAGYIGAIDYVVQTQPDVQAVQVEGGPRLSVFGTQVSGAKVFHRHTRKLVKLPFTLSALTIS